MTLIIGVGTSRGAGGGGGGGPMLELSKVFLTVKMDFFYSPFLQQFLGSSTNFKFKNFYSALHT